MQLKIREGQLKDLPEMQQLFVETISTVCINDYNLQQIAVWASPV